MTGHDEPTAADEPTERVETLEEFENSFFYGSRSNLNAKFLASLSPTDAADVIAGLLGTIDDAEQNMQPGRQYTTMSFIAGRRRCTTLCLR